MDPPLNLKAELVWIVEQQRRQDEHIAEVKRCLNRRLGASVHLLYGPSLEVDGVVEDVTSELVFLRPSDTRNKLVPLLQVEATRGRSRRFRGWNSRLSMV